MFIAGMILACAFVWVIAYKTFLSDNPEGWVGWVTLVVALALGVVCGFLLIKFVYVGAFVMAAWGGFALSLLLYNSVMYLGMNETGLWCFSIGMALVCGILALIFVDHILILATAMAGSFLVIEAVGIVAGSY